MDVLSRFSISGFIYLRDVHGGCLICDMVIVGGSNVMMVLIIHGFLSKVIHDLQVLKGGEEADKNPGYKD
jgi:hypothetical protein